MTREFSEQHDLIGNVEDTHLQRIRRWEIETVRSWFQAGARVLEIGGGNGFQASMIASWGCDVSSIDLSQKRVPSRIFFHVQDYDGRTIPFLDSTFDIVFSSNVLEHVRTLGPMFDEIRRVLSPNGRAIHILPSSAWRFWSSLAHYIFAWKWLLGLQQPVPDMLDPPSIKTVIETNGFVSLLKQLVLAGAHGEYPNAFYELYYFSKRRWMRVFRENGFEVLHAGRTGLFYTAFALFPGLSIKMRRRFAKFLGSACNTFVMRPVSK